MEILLRRKILIISRVFGFWFLGDKKIKMIGFYFFDVVFVGLDKYVCGCGFEDIFLKGFDMFCCFCVCFFIVV